MYDDGTIPGAPTRGSETPQVGFDLVRMTGNASSDCAENASQLRRIFVQCSARQLGMQPDEEVDITVRARRVPSHGPEEREPTHTEAKDIGLCGGQTRLDGCAGRSLSDHVSNLAPGVARVTSIPLSCQSRCPRRPRPLAASPAPP